MTPKEHMIENFKNACNQVLDDYNAKKITATERDEKLKKLSINWNKLENK